MPRTQVIAVYIAPVPVGHRVTVRWYRQDKTGLFGGKKTKQRDYEPHIIDHDTGIEYVSDFAHDGGDGIKSPDTPIAISESPAGGMEVDREITGKITRCRVVHIRSFSEVDVQTHLEVESDQ